MAYIRSIKYHNPQITMHSFKIQSILTLWSNQQFFLFSLYCLSCGMLEKDTNVGSSSPVVVVVAYFDSVARW